jgi:hypothetical protein
MTPDDMEGRTRALAAWLNSSTHEPWAFSSAQAATDLRALLLDYQERGRALEELLASTVGPEVGAGDGGTFVIQPPSPDALQRARATLKGKSHD